MQLPAPVVVDAHTHVFPPEVVTNRDRWRKRDDWFSLLYANPKSRLVTAEELIESMDSAGIGRSIMCGFPWRDKALCDEHNAYMRDMAARFPNRLSWLAIVSPDYGARLEQATADLLTGGASGIGELNADAQGFDLTDIDLLSAALVVCEELAKPVMLHASEPVGHTYPGKGTATPDKLLHLATAFPRLSIVLAHWGGGLPFYELMPEVRAALANATYDSGASTYLFDASVFQHVAGIVGVEKVLFGSDFPVLRQDRLLDRVSSLSWRDDQHRKAVLGGNAMRVYGLPEREGTGK